MEIQTLAREAHEAIKVIDTFPWKDREMHGIEVTPGFFNIYNEVTGQSKTVVFHPESGYLFKRTSWAEWVKESVHASNRHLGEIKVDGVTYPVRLPFFQFFDLDGEAHIEVQEYIYGGPCDCNLESIGYDCSHRKELRALTRYNDCHQGNWKLTNDGEIVLFDFDGMKL